MGVVSTDQEEAIYSVAFMTGYHNTHPIILPFPGLRASFEYDVRSIWPHDFKSSTILEEKEIEKLGIGGHFSGAILMNVGMQLPPSFPETVHLFHLTKKG